MIRDQTGQRTECGRTITNQFFDEGRWWFVLDDAEEVEAAGAVEVIDLCRGQHCVRLA